MDAVTDFIGTALAAVVALADSVVGALGTSGSIMLVATAAIGLAWLAGRTLKL